MTGYSCQRFLTIKKHCIVNHQVASLSKLGNLLRTRGVAHIDKATLLGLDAVSEILRLMHRRDILHTNVFWSHKNYVESHPRAWGRLKFKDLLQNISCTCRTYHSDPLGSIIHRHCPDKCGEVPNVIRMGV